MLNKTAFALVLFGAMTMAPNLALADVTLVHESRPLARIYLSKPQDRTAGGKPFLEIAAEELNYHFKKMSGAALEVVPFSDANQVKGPAIVLGEAANAMGAIPQKNVDSHESFRLLTIGDTLLVGGQSDEAVLFGAYHLLEKLGCDWLMPGQIGEIIPLRKSITIAELDESQAPDFLIRNLWYTGGDRINTVPLIQDFSIWKRRQREGRYDPAQWQTRGHAWHWFVPRHQAEFDKDPTMYALVREPNGEMVRRGLQIESTHPRVIELFVQDIREAFRKNNWPHDKEVGFPIGPADTMGYSLSSESLLAGSGRIDPLTGELDRTDELILLANKIQERIQADYPRVWLGFYSYSVHADYPLRYRPNPRTAMIFAPIMVSRFHSILDENSKSQPYYRSVVEKWAELSKEQGNTLIYRGYNWNLADNMLPYTKLQIWGQELPYYHKLNFMGLSVEAARSWSITGPSDWLFMKLAWNTKRDWQDLLHEYCSKAFGAGAAPMQEYFQSLVARQRDAGQEAGSYHAFHLMYDANFVREAERKFARAQRLAQTQDEKTRIRYFASPVETLRLYLNYQSAASRFDFAAVKSGYNAMFKQHEKVEAMRPDLVSPYTPIYLKRFLQDFAYESALYSSAPYNIVHRLPDEMPTLIDPQAAGAKLGIYSPELNDASYLKTKTFGSTWDAQGLASVRGAVWYRHRFKLPESLKGKPIGLFLGGFDDEARVWLNGRYIGSSGQVFSKPALFDLTEEAGFGKDNLLAIQVVKGTVNELGTGGLIRPSFLFTGPRLNKKAPELAPPSLLRPGAGELQP